MRFATITKQPKDKYQVIREPNTVIGHIDYELGKNEYTFTPLHGSKYNAKDLCEVCDFITQKNNELK